ncbi:hypothetical protein PCC9214_04398 [Planktothrix tepida]|uniref:Uncharacterized protein n=2 Tax=Planktothrix TaxID=54304 RepID=A0A1J1LVG2_9CYAN|nr:hypothetical protein NO713_01241 [Planktothrix pseudagardhii]CAD5978550.1 hypothetical protein PCC9214_04398 [Planktothrix tepida]CUR36098.1 conserved hypothetical protein [Planktothrix tepida PCC 9214]
MGSMSTFRAIVNSRSKVSLFKAVVKYFFLTDGWTVGRVWGVGGLWDQTLRRRPPEIQKMNLCIWNQTQQEKMWLYRVEDAVLMLEVKPDITPINKPSSTIGQVVLTRLITADQVLERLASASTECQMNNSL